MDEFNIKELFKEISFKYVPFEKFHRRTLIFLIKQEYDRLFFATIEVSSEEREDLKFYWIKLKPYMVNYWNNLPFPCICILLYEGIKRSKKTNNYYADLKIIPCQDYLVEKEGEFYSEYNYLIESLTDKIKLPKEEELL